MSAITHRQTIPVRFRLNMATQDALDLLAAAYRAEVEYRHGILKLDQNTLANLATLATIITQPDPKFGIMCCGTCGNGKTTLLYAFRRLVNYLRPLRHFDFLSDGIHRYDATVGIYTAKEICAISRNDEKIEAIKNRTMVAIDDLGSEPLENVNYGNVTTPVTDIIEHRYNRQLFTFITTNLIPSEIRGKYGARIADRFNEMLHVITFKDITYRTKS